MPLGPLVSVPIEGGAAVSVPPGDTEPTNLDLLLAQDGIVHYKTTPDGTRVVYQRGGLFVAPVDGGTPIRLDLPDVGSPAYRRISISPDSTMAASVMFTVSDGEGDYDPISLFVTPLDGGPATILHELREFGDLHDLDPEDWSPSDVRFTPDARRVVYRMTTFLYSTSVHGGPPIELANGAGAFALTPDSSTVIYLAHRDGDPSAPSELYSVPPSGGPAILVSHPDGVSSVVRWIVTPDGEWVLFVQDVGWGPALFKASVAGGARSFLDEGGDWFIAVTADGEHVLYAAARDSQLRSTRVDGGIVAELGGPLARSCTACAKPAFLITPDGTRVVFGLDTGGKVLELHSIPIEGGVATRLSRPLGPNEAIAFSGTSIAPDSRHVVFRVLRRTWAPLGPGCVRRGGLELCPPPAPGLPGWFSRLPNWDVPILHSARLPPLVRIDVEPRHAENRARLEGRGWVSVAILGSDDVDVADVELGTLAFGPDAAPPDRKVKRDDVDGDGFTDLVTRYRRDETGLAPGDARACLSGSHDGFDFDSCDDLSAPGS